MKKFVRSRSKHFRSRLRGELKAAMKRALRGRLRRNESAKKEESLGVPPAPHTLREVQQPKYTIRPMVATDPLRYLSISPKREGHRTAGAGFMPPHTISACLRPDADVAPHARVIRPGVLPLTRVSTAP